jgi:hypothetical protein
VNAYWHAEEFQLDRCTPPRVGLWGWSPNTDTPFFNPQLPAADPGSFAVLSCLQVNRHTRRRGTVTTRSTESSMVVGMRNAPSSVFCPSSAPNRSTRLAAERATGRSSSYGHLVRGGTRKARRSPALPLASGNTTQATQPSKLAMRVRFPSPAPMRCAGHSPSQSQTWFAVGLWLGVSAGGSHPGDMPPRSGAVATCPLSSSHAAPRADGLGLPTSSGTVRGRTPSVAAHRRAMRPVARSTSNRPALSAAVTSRRVNRFSLRACTEVTGSPPRKSSSSR